MNSRNQNTGTNLMVLQQQYNHQKRLRQIYQQPSKSAVDLQQTLKRMERFKNNKKVKQGRENSFVKQQHIQNITRLLYSITKEKTNHDRLKDPHDFIAYPSLFFRTVGGQTPIKKKKRPQKVRLTTHSQKISEEPSPSIEKIRQSLPILSTFQQDQLEEWADSVSKLIINFNIMHNKAQLLAFAAKVISLLPKKCPYEFRQAAQKILDDICCQKVDIW